MTEQADKLEALLKRRTLTAAGIAKALGLAKSTVSERVKRLKKRVGGRLLEKLVREGKSGPSSIAYSIKGKS